VETKDPFFDGFLDDYFAECEEHLTAARRSLLALESAVGQPGAERAPVEELFRYYHSLKGISAMVELRPAEVLAHHLENYLRVIRQREIDLTTEGVDVLIDGTRLLETVINAHRFGRPQPSIDDVVARVERLTTIPRAEEPRVAVPAGEADAAGSGGVRRWLCTFVPTHELMARGVGVDAIRKQLSAIGRIVSAVPDVRPDGAIAFKFTLASDAPVEAFNALRDNGVAVEEIEKAPDEAAATGAAGSQPLSAIRGDDASIEGGSVSPSHVVRVDLTRLDELMRSVGDLVISRARLTDSLARIESFVPAALWRTIQDNTIAIDRQLRTLREGIMRVRLVPIGEIFRRMPFVVRDLARETGKKVKLELQGQATEIDKYLIERMLDPVVHLVRNAVSHGLETAEERMAQGKRPDGTIALSASTAGEIVSIEIADDGRGIDAAAVVARARAIGLPVPGETADPATLLSLICAPGFSTKADTDRASGRGVGMAVVKSTVEQLAGTMTLETEPGRGTRFIIQLPLTLAITDALIGRVGSESFAVPQSVVREVMEIAESDIRIVEQNEIVPYRGGALTVVRLGKLFGIDSRPGSRSHLFVIGHGTASIGLAVDRIVGQREIVVRTIADPLVKVDGISGATDLGDGRVVLILDPAALARLTRERAVRVHEGSSDWGRVRA
jgi:two-component system, chemotaxis family, sensor kinase CheA